jgi:hypothetical protein
MKNILLTILTLVALTAPIAGQAQDMNVQSITKPKNCFVTDRKFILVPYNLTKEQKKTLTMIKASSIVIDNLKLSWSLENDFLACLNKGRTINGFTKKVIPTFAAYPNMTIYTSNLPFIYLQNGQESKSYNVKAKVSVSYSPATGYKVTAEINPIN